MILATACVTQAPAAPGPATGTNPGALAPTQPVEVAVTQIPLEGPITKQKAETSGLTWYGDYLIILPQYPSALYKHPGGALYAIPREQIEAFLDGTLAGPITPTPVPFTSGRIEKTIDGFEGFEAVVFTDNQIFLLIEAKQRNKMKSILVRGEVEPDLSEIRIDTASLTDVPLDVQISNFSNESLVVDGDRLLLFYEANGELPYRDARALRYTLDLQPDGSIPMENLEYRLTDASTLDSEGRFWVTNFFFPGDIKIMPRKDPVADLFGKGPTHAEDSVVERLVEFQLPAEEGGEITLSGRPPVQLVLTEGLIPRNWEGIARLEGRGFLLVTDRYPESILAFVPYTE